MDKTLDKKTDSPIKILRGPKIGGIAAFDLLATVATAGIIARMAGGGVQMTIIAFSVLMIIAIGIHWYIGIPTMLNYYLNINTLEEVMEARQQSV